MKRCWFRSSSERLEKDGEPFCALSALGAVRHEALDACFIEYTFIGDRPHVALIADDFIRRKQTSARMQTGRASR
jgi:hypothetical protein